MTPMANVQKGFLSEPMGMFGIVLFGLYFALLSVVSAQLLIGLWPGQKDPVSLLGGLVRVVVSEDAEARLTLVALLAGALGSFVHAATSFATYLGNRQLIRSWAGWYALRPFIGMALALIVYFLIRGGFISPSANGTAISPYGVAAVAGLAGMFSKQATDKLQDVFKQLLQPPASEEQLRGDKLTATGAAPATGRSTP
jgi:hypothetical protein